MIMAIRFGALAFSLTAAQLMFAAPDAVTTSLQTAPAAQIKATANYAQMPLAFEMNEGQTDPQVKALSRGSGYGLFLTDDESVLVLSRKSGQSAAIHVKMLGAKTARVVPGRPAGWNGEFVHWQRPIQVAHQYRDLFEDAVRRHLLGSGSDLSRQLSNNWNTILS